MAIYDFDIYNHPESVIEVKKDLMMLREQIKIVEGLEHARARLVMTNPLTSHTLSKCDAFMRYVNHTPCGSNFNSEVQKLSLEELAFCSISFEERRLKSVIHHFKASNIRTYMENARPSCLDRPEVFRRLRRLSAQSEGKPFHELYTAICEEHNNSVQSGSTESDDHMADETLQAPTATTAEQRGAFELPAAQWANIEKVFPAKIATAIRHVDTRINDPNITDCVRSRFPRDRAGDAVIWLDVETVGIQPLLCGSGPGVGTAQIRDVFGDAISHAIEESDLRKWEKINGDINKTACVKVKRFCHVELRVGCHTTIAQTLFS